MHVQLTVTRHTRNNPHNYVRTSVKTAYCFPGRTIVHISLHHHANTVFNQRSTWFFPTVTDRQRLLRKDHVQAVFDDHHTQTQCYFAMQIKNYACC